MKLSKKIFILFIFSFVISLLIVYTLSRAILLKNFNKIEINNANSDTKRVLSLINSEAISINLMTIDYAKWDATYDFMVDLNSKYLYQNFGENNIFQRTGINLIFFLDSSNNIIYSKFMNVDTDTIKLLSTKLNSQFTKEISNYGRKHYTSGVNGIYLLSDIPMIISIQPVLPSSSKGTPRGFLVVAEFLNEPKGAALSKTLTENIKLEKYNKNTISNCEYIFNNVYIKIINDKKLISHGVINDLNGNPAAMAKITLERTIFNQASKSIKFFINIQSLIGIIFFTAIFCLINVLVVKRIKAITEKIDIVSNTQDLSIRINMKGSDELSQLGEHFNIMFSSLQKTKEQILDNIREKLKDEERILNLANYDTLTKLPNRKKLIEVSNDLIQNKNNIFALFFIDLDNFKNINDSMGHEAGDIILKQVVLRLQKIPGIKDYIFRMGGDEFIIIYNNLHALKDAEVLAKEINSILAPPFSYGNNNFYIGASIGISFYPKDGTDMQTLMKNSDTAMYEAKRKESNTYKVFSSEMNEKNISALHMGNALRVAVENNEFIVHYQPIINIATMETVGCEGLIRWNHDKKIIYPSKFIQLAKDIGIMVTIDNWMLLNACKQCKAWHEKGFNNLYVSVNVSFNQLKQPNFTKMVSKTLNNIDLPSKFLNLEITEDEAMVDVNLILEVLMQLKSIGVKISLDDFGTGYSSLSYVNKLPIDSLKIDRSLIQNLTKHSKNIEILKSIVYMANSLDIGIIVEGIEKEEELEILKNLNCHLIQGYLFSKPLEVTSFEKFIRHRLR